MINNLKTDAGILFSGGVYANGMLQMDIDSQLNSSTAL